MKKLTRTIMFLALVLFAGAAICSAEDKVTLDNGLTVNHREACGLDLVYPFDMEEAAPRAPKGYEAFFIEHYGRHGSRFAYDKGYYTTFKEALDTAEAKGMLTEKGRSIKADFESHYEKYIVRMGDLTSIGFEQHRKLGREMVENYPSIFKRPGATVFAVASDYRRAIMSMSGFCVGMCQAQPGIEIKEDQGNCYLNATQPKSPKNPYPVLNYPVKEFPFPESAEEFCHRKTDCCPGVLSALFTDPDAVLQSIGKERFLLKLYVLVAGMQSLDPEDRTDFSGVFAPDEYARMWEVDNYRRYYEYFNYPVRTLTVLKDMIDDADDAIASGKRGASLRFGHDHVVMPLFVLLHLNGYSVPPASADGLSKDYRTFDCPMASNIQMVLYRSRKGGDVLVNIRVNGRTATVDGLSSVHPGFYRWSELKEIVLQSRPS